MLSTIILFIVILGLLVFVHELGHFIVARRTGMAVEEFGFGFPPRLIGFKRRPPTLLDGSEEKAKPSRKWELFLFNNKSQSTPDKLPQTIYSINMIPVGGFVKIKGEQGDSKNDSNSFTHKKIWQRTVVLAAGVTMNIVLAFVLITAGFSFGSPSVVSNDLPSSAHISNTQIQIYQLQKDSPAEKAGLKAGDFVMGATDQAFVKTEQFQEYIRAHAGQPITVQIKRNEQLQSYTVTPTVIEPNGQSVIGVYLVDTGIVRYPWYYAIWMGLKTTGLITWQIIVAFFELLKNLITSGHVSADIAGPIGIAAMTGQVAKLGWLYILQFTALLSINLAIINFIPFPALDGGRVLFLILEKIRGRAVNQRIEATIHNLGFLLLLALVAVVTFRDISRMSDSIRGFFGNIF